MKPGPKEDRVKIDCGFEDAIKIALSKRRPIGGWPKLTQLPMGDGNKLNLLLKGWGKHE